MPVPARARALALALVPGRAPEQVPALVPVPVRELGPEQARGQESDSAPSAKYFHTPPQAAGPLGRRIEVNRFGTD